MDNTQTEDIKDQFGSTVSDMEQDETIVKEPVIGEYKTDDKFIEFIGAKGNMNFISNEATIEAKYLSGLGLDGVVLKLTICDEGTVNFDEVDTNITTKEQRGRLLDIISEKTITPFRKRMVVQELPFVSTKQFNGSNINLYLSVEFNKPINKLASLLDEEEVEITDEQSSKLDALMSMFDEDVEDSVPGENANDSEESDETPVPEAKPEPKEQVINLTEQSFNKIKENKIIELTTRMENKKKELQRFKMDISQSEKKVKDAEDDIKLLEDRLESLQPQEQFTGYYFNVSERLNEKINLDASVAEIIKNKISKVKSINAEAFMKLFEDGEYRIRLGQMVDGVVTEIDDYKSLSTTLSETASNRLKKMSGLGLDENSNLIYHGDSSWGDLINKMVKLGFEQDGDFDKYCGSNSYKIYEDKTPKGEFYLADENGNPLPDTTESSTALANAIGNMYNKSTSKPSDTDEDITNLEDDVFVKCKIPEIDNPGDIRDAIIKNIDKSDLEYILNSDDDSNDASYTLVMALGSVVKNWPQTSEKSDGYDENDNSRYSEFEDLDGENTELYSLDENSIVVSSGGDWQTPLKMTIECDEFGDMYVTSFGIDNIDKDSISNEELKSQLSVASRRDRKIDKVVE